MEKLRPQLVRGLLFRLVKRPFTITYGMEEAMKLVGPKLRGGRNGNLRWNQPCDAILNTAWAAPEHESVTGPH